MATYVNDLRLTELATGEGSGTWGVTTNTNLELVAEAFSFGTEAITTNADTHTTTIADGSTDPGRSMFLKYTGTLDSTCTITIGPNTVSKLWFIENATSGSQSIIIKQGSGATVTIANGQTKAIYSDGAGSGGAMVDALQDLAIPDLFIDDDLTVGDDLTVTGLATVGETLGVTGVLTANAGVVVDNITIDGTEIDLSSGDLTIDVAGDIKLDAGGNDWIFLNGGTAIGRIINSSSDFVIQADVADKDIIFKGDDGGSAITALTLDMSEAGEATFNGDVKLGEAKVLRFGTDQDFRISFDGTNAVLQNVTGDSDIVFKGKDDTSIITALTLDMSAAGIATFNSGINIGNRGSASDPTLQSAIDPDTGIFWGGSNILGFSSGGVERLRVSSEVVVNDPSNDVDFRVESNSNTHMLFVDAGNNTVSIGSNSSDGTLHVESGSAGTITSAAAANELVLESDGPVGMSLLFDDEANDAYGNIYWGNETDGNADGRITYFGSTYVTAADRQSMVFRTAGTEKLRIASDNRVGIGEASPDSPLHVTTSSSGNILTLESTDSGTSTGPSINLFRNSSSPAANDLGPAIYFRGDNSAGGSHTYASIYSQFTDVTDGAEDTTVHHQISIAGNNRSVLSLKSDEVVINEESRNVDFRVESDGNTHMLFVDGGTNQVHVATSGVGPSNFNVLDHMSITNSGGAQYLLMGNQDSAGANNPSLILSANGVLMFGNGDSWSSSTGGTLTETFRMGLTEVVANESSRDQDFRVESDGNTHMLFVDAGNNVVFIGKSSGSTSIAGIEATVNSNLGQFVIAKTNSGTHNAIRFFHDGANVGNIQYSDSATSYLTSSDRRLKENISNADDAGDLIDAIQVRQFDWIVDGEHQRYGMVAQELNAVAPEAVSTPEDSEDMMGVDYSKLVPMLVKEIQSLRARVAQLESN
jgi:hypothetical protein